MYVRPLQVDLLFHIAQKVLGHVGDQSVATGHQMTWTYDMNCIVCYLNVSAVFAVFGSVHQQQLKVLLHRWFSILKYLTGRYGGAHLPT